MNKQSTVCTTSRRVMGVQVLVRELMHKNLRQVCPSPSGSICCYRHVGSQTHHAIHRPNVTLSASCSAVYCNHPCLFVCLWWLKIACINPHQTGFVDKGSGHLKLIKFWPSRAPGKGVCGGVKIFGSPLLQPVRSVCIALSVFFSCEVLKPLAGVWPMARDLEVGWLVFNGTFSTSCHRHMKHTIKQ